MKTTLDLPDELLRVLKIKAASENRRLKDVLAETVRRGLAHTADGPDSGRPRVSLPLVHCAHEARPGEEMTPRRVAEVLAQEEAATVAERT